MEGNGVFYVASEDNNGKTKDVTPEIKSSWTRNSLFMHLVKCAHFINIFDFKKNRLKSSLKNINVVFLQSLKL